MAEIEATFPEPLKCLFEPKRYKVLWGGRGAGRCLGKGTKVLLLSGDLKRVEDVEVGDILMGPDSHGRNVLSVMSGNGPLFRIDQAGGAISYIVNGEHVLSLKKSHTVGQRRRRAQGREDEFVYHERYVNWPDIVNMTVSEYVNKSLKWRSCFFGYKAGFIDFGLRRRDFRMPIDPHFLGLWLGDGTSRELRLTVNVDEWNDLESFLCSCAVSHGCWPKRYEKEGVFAYDVGFGTETGRVNEFWRLFTDLELYNNKHIPPCYLIAEEEDRLELLAGLLDSDGYMNNNGYVFTSTIKKLALDTKILADFLGFKTSLHVKKANSVDRKSDAYNISINGDVWRIPCLVKHKKVGKDRVSKNKDFLINGIEVVPIGDGEYFGFDIDGDHLFVLEDGTVTHNSWGVARALLLEGTKRPMRYLCARELQNSIAESVHRVLADQITALGLSEFYDVQVNRILGKNGTAFAFEGIKNNVNKIKSYEGIDICWVEEANKVSRNSWGILIPTIRKESSEIWMTFNPELETDYTYRRFVLEADPSLMHVIKMTWKDNPWFPDVLRDEMERDKKLDYDHYLNIWEGFCLQILEGAIYARELRRAQEESRICSVPYDRGWPVDTFWDLGRADATAIWFAQRVAMQYRVLDYYCATGEGDISHYLHELQNRGYVYGTAWLPHDAKAKRLGTKKSIEEQIRQAGYRVRVVPRLSLTDGINAARMVFPTCWFDENRCEEGLQALRHYRYRVADGHYSNEPVHDWASDAADAFRYMAVALKERPDVSPGIAVMERLKGFAAAALKKRGEELEVEFSGRPRASGSGWMR